ncbi:ATP-binding protein [Clostridium fallax]|uniref:DNA replication protein DnaC n=1 Tax=Clostridium fallax TaxID=1533 RepID=A0A1M4ZBF3_9CLOT|nr:ATP-binding protein [Clostridium fallax]SHF15370.1 DNA replication protein DnaC [Clostridium fallax]SQB22258.1 DNA replication protein DnaC [Clostridium fallax]
MENSFSCPLCQNTGWIEDKERNVFIECKCVKEKKAIELLIRTGLSNEQLKTNFTTFKVWNESVKRMKEVAIRYYLDYEKIKNTTNNSLALLGESGSGKTHLLSALINNFVSNKGIDIAYISYIDTLIQLKQNIISSELYQDKINRFKKSSILVIDDLFKGGFTDSDIRIVLEIINYRYSAKLPFMISSELYLDDLIKVDKALGGRIAERTKGHIYEIKGIKNNYRLNKKD